LPSFTPSCLGGRKGAATTAVRIRHGAPGWRRVVSDHGHSRRLTLSLAAEGQESGKGRARPCIFGARYRVVVLGSPGVDESHFAGKPDVLIMPDPPEGHMAGPKTLLESLGPETSER
jgi:hypothetical protein